MEIREGVVEHIHNPSDEIGRRLHLHNTTIKKQRERGAGEGCGVGVGRGGAGEVEVEKLWQHGILCVLGRQWHASK
jgi:hypothetical protein